MVKFKQYVIYNYIFGIIVFEFSYKQKYCLLILFLIDKSLEIKFYYAILFFDLAIYLEMKSYRKPLFYAQKIVQKQPKF